MLPYTRILQPCTLDGCNSSSLAVPEFIGLREENYFGGEPFSIGKWKVDAHLL